MTVPSTTRRAGPFTGTGIPTTYPFAFRVFEEADIAVTIADTDGVEIAGVLNSDFIVTLNVDQDTTPGGFVQYAVGGIAQALPTGYLLGIDGARAYSQEADLPQGGNFNARAVEDALDSLEMQIQQIRDSLDRAVRLTVLSPLTTDSTLPIPEAGALLGWNADGTVLQNYPIDTPTSMSDLETRLLGAASALNGGGMIGLNFSLNYAAATVGQALRQRVWCITDYPWNAVGNDSTDNYAAILAAQTALSAAGGGTLLIPRGNFRYNTAIPRVSNVDYEGTGWSSVLKPVSCSAFTYAYTTGFDQSRTANLAIQAVTGGSQIGIYQPGTLNDADELYGILVENCAIRGFNIGMKFRTVRNVTLRNNWIQDCNSGVHLIGKCLVVNISDHKSVFAAGSGSGTQYGIYCDLFNYTSGSGNIRPETVRIERAHIYGYTNGIALTGVVFSTVKACDIQATGVGVSWSTVGAPIAIESNYIQVAGAGATVAVYGLAQASALDSSISIRHNHINAVSTTAGTSVGLQLGDAGNGNQDNVRIENNSFTGFTKYDIAFYKSGHITIRGNQCYSTGVTNSIFSTALAANRPSYVSENDCYSTIAADAGDIASGLLQLGKNIINQTTVDYGNAGYSGWITQAYASGDFTAAGAMSWTVASGDLAVFDYRILGKEMLVNIIINTSTVGGTVNSPLKIKIPGGRSCARRAINPCHILDNGTRLIAYFEVDPAGDATQINVSKADGSNWTLSTDNTYVRGQLTIPLV